MMRTRIPGIAALLAAAGMTLGAGLALREPAAPANPAQATFAGGCFWCMEPPFDQLPGVASTTSGYTGGRAANPSYDQVSSGGTGHAEAVQVVYDPKQVTYAELLEVFWRNIDPFARNAQFCDHGPQYRSAIFVHDEGQRRLAEDSKRRVERHFGRKVETEIVPAPAFYRAEEYHQDFYRKNPLRYKQYRQGCGRDRRLAQVWGEVPAALFKEPVAAHSMKKGWSVDFKKPADADLKKKLSPLQYTVTQHEGTEPPFRNEFWDEHRAGIYVDVVSGEPLFSSLDKFDSGTGWPSFTRPLEPDNVRKRTDFKLMLPRTEVRSSHADSHLGHVFEDGPAPTGLRYCINSAALRFIPAEKLEEEGYGEFVSLFQEAAKRR